jgi:hypothetical protein
MALFQRRRLRSSANGNEPPPLGLVMPARCVNTEELMLHHEMHRCPDGILGFFVVYEDENGELENVLLPRPGNKRETDLQQFMRFAGLTEVPTMDQIMAIKQAALARLEEKWAPKIQAARTSNRVHDRT